jgi:serine/threonine protein kinase
MPIDPRLPPEIFLARARQRPQPPIATRRARDADDVLPRGTTLDKYRIEELVGRGAFGAVYRATHALLETTVAIKLLRAEVVARKPEVVTQLVEEARLAARIRHPNVVRVLDVTRTPEVTFVVMEFIDGESLAAAIAVRGRLEAARVIDIGIDVAEGLAAGLAEEIVHRDVKPSNVLLARDGRACVIDLGLARAAVSERSLSTPSRGFVGTRGYAAPEQLVDPERVDFRADIYALGVTLDEALRGKRRRGDATLDSDPCARALSRVVYRMLAPDPHDRPSSYRELVEALRAARGVT